MVDENVHSEGVWIAGGDIGQYGHEMNDNDGNGVYTITLELPSNTTIMYKFRNQSSYGTWDGFEPALINCGMGQYNDRYVDIGEEDIVLDVVKYGSCNND